MQFTVRDWMVDVIVFVDPNATVSEALALMRRRYIQDCRKPPLRHFDLDGYLRQDRRPPAQSK
jgi:hypothetical protein